MENKIVGLTTKEAEMSKPNKEKRKTDNSYLRIILKNICTPFNLVLIGIALSYIILGIVFDSKELRSFSNYTFLVIALANSIIGIVSEFYSKHILDKVNIINNAEYEVYRDQNIVKVPSDQLVQKDIIICHIGNQVPVDGVIVEGTAEFNESMLTGESDAIKKSIDEEVYAGSYIVSGTVNIKATSVGDDRYVSKLQSKAKATKESKTELVLAINKIIKWGMIFMIPLAILNFLKFFITGNAVIDVIRNILAPIVGMIPCGMLLLTSVALSTGIIKLAKRKTLVQDLYSIEMLARVDTLCFDKTGTLTDGGMTVENIYVVDPKYEIGKILGSYISATGTNTPTAKAIYERYKDYSLKEKVVNTIPFSSARKWDAVEFEDSGTFILGAPDYVNVIGKKEIFDDDICNFIREENSIARRTLLLAHSNESADDPNFIKISPVAVISIRQNLRENVSEMIDWFYENDVDVRIISGDDLRTVTKIAHDAGIRGYENGYSLDRMSDVDVVKIVPETKIFARVSPDQKALIVKTLKENGKTVGVTGDGVNDILAMKNSDCSIAMGEGSDAARSVSNIVLLDSDFNNMPEVVREGRRVINNVQRSSTVFVMKTIMVGILTFLSILFVSGGGYPLIHQNIEGISLGVAGLGSFLLAMEPFSEKISGSFLKNILKSSIPAGIFLALSAIIPYTLGVLGFTENGLQMAVLSLNLASILVFFYIARPFNMYRLVAMGIVFIFTVIVVALPVVVPSLERFFFVLRSIDLANVKPIDILIGVFGVISAQLIYERIR